MLSCNINSCCGQQFICVHLYNCGAPTKLVSLVPPSICARADPQNWCNFIKFYILNIRIELFLISNFRHCIRIEILILMTINNAVFWDLTRRRLVDIYRHYGGPFFVHPQGRSVISGSLATFTDTFKFYWKFVDWDSSVGIEDRYGLDGPGNESRQGRDFFTRPDSFWGPPSLLYNG
jgi:hypothetical protein